MKIEISKLPDIPKITSENIEYFNEETNSYDSAKKELDLEQTKQVIKLRKEYAPRIHILTCIWILFVIIVIFFQGFKFYKFILSDSVIIALLGTTTATIIGLFVIILKDIFPGKKSN